MSTAAVDPMTAGAWAGQHLGEKTVGYTQDQAILYALAVGSGVGDGLGRVTISVGLQGPMLSAWSTARTWTTWVLESLNHATVVSVC